MTIEVKQIMNPWDYFDLPTPISVKVNGRCNHAVTDIEVETFDNGRDVELTGAPLKLWTEKLEVCADCHAWRFLGGEWYGV